jgi:hypothetical protein
VCSRCDDVPSSVEVRTPGEYHTVLAMARAHLTAGALALVSGTCSLEDVTEGAPWPADYIEHTFACTQCGRCFRLEVETYHGSGGGWEVVAV